MLTKDIRKTIDNARDVLVGKIPNPQSQIEQITIAMIYKFMDDMDIETVELGGNREFFVEELSEYAWSKIMSPQLGNEARMNLYTEALDKLQLSNRIPKLFRDIFKGAYLPFRDGQTLTLFLKEINDLSYNNSENLGNGFEYLLSIMGSQGDAGQFRTPRHIIDFIVDIVKPTKADTILDPACGTAGFLISAYKFIQKTAEDTKQPLTPKERTSLTENIQGYDISPDMVKLALVNMYLHKFKNPKIYEYDTLTQDTRWDNYFDCILANPPFMTPKGGIQPHNKFGVKANRSEVLFVDYIMEHLNSTGRAGVIVPEGIVFQSANAYKELRKKLVEENYLYAVVSLPSGIFQPYSGVKTSILFMDRQLAKKSDKVLFVEIQNDGFDLGAQRRPIDKNDLPKALELINKWQNSINAQTEFSADSKMITIVEKSKLAENEEYNLTASRYKVAQDFSNCKWDMVKLGDVCELKRGFAFKSEDYVSSGILNFRVTNIGNNGAPDLTDSKYLPENFLIKYADYQLSEGDFLIVMVGATTGKVGYITKDMLPALLNQNMWKFVPDEKKLNKRFLYFLMKHRAVIQRQGGARDYLKQADFILQQIPLPPLEVQEEIVKELDGYQAVIDGAQKVVDNWKPTLPINPEWEKVKLGDVCEINPKKSQVAEIDKSTLVSFVPMECVSERDMLFTPKENRKIGEVYSGYTYFTDNDVLLAKVTPCFENGKSGLARNLTNSIGFGSSEFFVLRANETILPEIIYYTIVNNKFIENGKDKMSGTGGLKRVVKDYVENYEFLVPPDIDTQRETVLKIQEEEKAIEECKKLIKLHQDKINTKIQSIWGDSCE